MSRKRLNPTLVGAFILCAIALLVTALLYFGSDRLSGEKVPYVAYFYSDTSGLDPGAAVTLRGVEIGTVSSIRVGYAGSEKGFFVRVGMDIDRAAVLWPAPQREQYLRDIQQTYRSMIDQELRARLELQSVVTGKLMVQLGLFPDTPVRLRAVAGDPLEFPTIPARLERLVDALAGIDVGRIADTIEHLAERLAQIADASDLPGLQARLQQTLSDISRLSTHLDAQVEPVGAAISKTGDEAARLLRRLDQSLPALIADIRGAAGSVGAAADTTRGALDKFGHLVGPDSPLRREASEALKHLSAAARSIDNLADYLERHPEALMSGKRR